MVTDGKIDERGRLPLRVKVLRVKGSITPCFRCPKVPTEAFPKTRQQAVELDDYGWQVYLHYLECAAVGEFPDDPLVRRHARIIKSVMDAVAEARVMQREQTLTALLSMALSRR